MSLPEPTMKLISWAVTRTAEAVVERAADRIAIKIKTGIVRTVRHRAAAARARRGRND
jgi:hypothetical protein